MESLLNSIEQSDSSSDHDSDEDDASLEIALQGPTAKSSSKVGTKRQTSAKRRPVSFAWCLIAVQVRYAYMINFISNLYRLLRELFL